MGGRGGSSHAAGGVPPRADTSILSAYTTTGEVSRWMKDQGWFTQWADVDLEGIAVDAAKSIALTYKRVFDTYPQVIGKFNGIVALTIGPRTYAQCYVQGGRIEVNKAFYNDTAGIASRYEKDLEANFHPKGTTWEAIVTHEIGHAINGYLDAAIRNMPEISSEYAHDWRNEIYATRGLRPNGIAVAFHNSRYATKNLHEWFAESFAEGMESASPRWAAKLFMEKLNELMKKVK